MKLLVITLIFFTMFSSSIFFPFLNKNNEIIVEYLGFKRKYQRSYGLSEEKYRFSIFSKNYKVIKKINNENRSYKLGINEFSDLSFEEFKNIYLGLIKTSSKKPIQHIKTKNNSFPLNFDWSLINEKVSKVKNQGQCGSCWAFSSTGMLESYLRIKENNNILLSEQELIDCSNKYGNKGCEGGLMSNSFKYIYENGLSSDNYSYEGYDNQCRKNLSKRNINSKKYYYKQAFHLYKNYNEVQKVLQNGPISVAVEVTNEFQLYSSGILQSVSSCGENLNHGILLVGYGTEKGITYTKLKNSWGHFWGEKGYIKISFENEKSDSCGITSTTSVLVEKIN